MRKYVLMVLIVFICTSCTMQKEVPKSKNVVNMERRYSSSSQTNESAEQFSEPIEDEKKIEKSKWNKEKIISEKKELGICYAYPSKDGKSCWLIKYKLDKNANVETVEFPSTIQGMKVTKIGPNPRRLHVDTIFGIHVWEDGDILIGSKKAKCLRKVKELVFSDGIEIIGEECLTGLENLERVILPKNLKQITPYAAYSNNIQYMELPEANKHFVLIDGMLIQKKNNQIVFMLTQRKEVEIPGNITELDYFYIRKGIRKIYIHSDVDTINYLYPVHAIELEVDKRNTKYVSKDTCVYEKETGELVAITIKNRTLNIAEGVKYITSNSDTTVLGYDYNYDFYADIEKIIYPKSIKRIQSGWSGAASWVKRVYRGNYPWVF